MAIRARGSGRCRGPIGDLWCRPFLSHGTDIRERRRGRLSTPRTRPVECKRLHSAILRGCSRRFYRRAGGPLRSELVAAPRRGLPMHGPGAGTALPQQRLGPYQWPYPSWRRPVGLCRPYRRRDLDGIAAWLGASWRLAASRFAGANCPFMAGRHCRRRRGRTGPPLRAPPGSGKAPRRSSRRTARRHRRSSACCARRRA